MIHYFLRQFYLYFYCFVLLRLIILLSGFLIHVIRPNQWQNAAWKQCYDTCSIHTIFQFHDEVHAHSVIFSLRCGGLQICSQIYVINGLKVFKFLFIFAPGSIYKYSKHCCHSIEFEMALTHAINKTFIKLLIGDLAFQVGELILNNKSISTH